MSAPVTIRGRLGANPEMRFSPSGMAVANLRVVTNGRKNVNGTWEDVDTTWLRVTCFKTIAENVCETLTKGSLVIVTGTVKSREWEDQKTGEKRSAFEVTADDIGPSLPGLSYPGLVLVVTSTSTGPVGSEGTVMTSTVWRLNSMAVSAAEHTFAPFSRSRLPKTCCSARPSDCP